MAGIDQDDATVAFRAPLVVLTLLTLVAGFGDGYSLSRYGVFVANQSGNIVHVGMGVAGQDPNWTMSLLSVVGFALGGAVAWILARRSAAGHWPTVRLRLILGGTLVVVWWIVLMTVASDDLVGLLSALVGAAAMGVLATALTRVAGLQAQTSFQSGTVLRSAQSLMSWAVDRRGGAHDDRRLVRIGLITVVSYAAGGALGAYGQASLHASSLLLVLAPIAVAAILAHRAHAGPAT